VELMIKHVVNLTQIELENIMTIWLETNVSAHSYISEEYWINNINFVKQELPKSDIYVSIDSNEEMNGFLGVQNGYIAGIFVKSECQKKGIGSQLIEAAKQDFDKLYLTVYEKNAQAKTFYEKQDFVVTAKQIDEENQEKEIIMTWKN